MPSKRTRMHEAHVMYIPTILDSIQNIMKLRGYQKEDIVNVSEIIISSTLGIKGMESLCANRQTMAERILFSSELSIKEEEKDKNENNNFFNYNNNHAEINHDSGNEQKCTMDIIKFSSEP